MNIRLRKVATPIVLLFLLFIFLAKGGGSSVVAAPGDETTYYLLTDHLGSVDVVLDEQGEVVERRDFLPYGQERSARAEPNSPTTAHKFTGKELDDETGLYYYGARYYDPLIGRFVSVDPWEGDLKNPQSLNKYAYVVNNPIKFVDPTGLYMKDVHYDLTYFLSTAAGLDSGQSKTIASFNQYMDENPATSPGNYKSLEGVKTLVKNYIDGTTSDNHFVPRGESLQRVGKAVIRGRLDEFGSALHTFQDTYSHEYLRPESHGSLLKAPDITKWRAERAMEMAKGSFLLLRAMNLKANGSGDLSAEEYNANSEAIWATANPYVSSFINASGDEKANTTVGRTAGLSAQDTQISSDGSRKERELTISAP